MVGEAKTDYVLAFCIYIGKVETSEARGSTHQVVVYLSDPYYGKNQHGILQIISKLVQVYFWN